MTTPVPDWQLPPDTWDWLCGDLPSHADEVMAAHSGLPTVVEQQETHGGIIPPASGWPQPAVTQ